MHWAAFILLSAGIVPAQVVNVPDLIKKSVAVENADFRTQPRYDYTVSERNDDEPARTWRQIMIDGSPYRELIAVGGKPLSPQLRDKEARKLRREIARRRQETRDARAARIAKYRQGRDQEHTMMLQMTKAFQYRLAGEGTLNGHAVYLLNATPRPGYVPPNRDSRVLLGMRGKLWLDQQTAHWVKVEAEVVQPVTFYGVLATVKPGTRFELEKTPVAGNTWLPAHFAMRQEATVLGLFSRRHSEDDRFFEYQPAQ